MSKICPLTVIPRLAGGINMWVIILGRGGVTLVSLLVECPHEYPLYCGNVGSQV